MKIRDDELVPYYIRLFNTIDEQKNVTIQLKHKEFLDISIHDQAQPSVIEDTIWDTIEKRGFDYNRNLYVVEFFNPEPDWDELLRELFLGCNKSFLLSHQNEFIRWMAKKQFSNKV